MKHSSDVEQQIRTIFNDRLQIEVSAVDQALFKTGILDSASFVEALVALEEEFCVQIALDRVDLNDFRTIAKIAHFISLQESSTDGVPRGRHSAV